MAENDIYNSKKKYEDFKAGLKDFLNPPVPDDRRKNNNPIQRIL